MRQPDASEIEKVGQALVLLSTFDYTPQQQACLHHFLCQYAQQCDAAKTAEIEKLFHDKQEVTQALKTLHDFASDFGKCQIFKEFKAEVEDLIFMLNNQIHNAS